MRRKFMFSDGFVGSEPTFIPTKTVLNAIKGQEIKIEIQGISSQGGSEEIVNIDPPDALKFLRKEYGEPYPGRGEVVPGGGAGAPLYAIFQAMQAGPVRVLLSRKEYFSGPVTEAFVRIQITEPASSAGSQTLYVPESNPQSFDGLLTSVKALLGQMDSRYMVANLHNIASAIQKRGKLTRKLVPSDKWSRKI